MSGTNAVAAVVINYNADELLVHCVRDLVAAGASEVVVVDNGSTDRSIEVLEQADVPNVRIDRVGANLGYGRAANRGAKQTSADLILVCNPDLFIDEHALYMLADRMAVQPDLGIVGPRLRNTDGTPYVTGRPFPSIVDAFGHAFVGQVWPGNPWSRRYLVSEWDRSDEAPDGVGWISGACMLIRRAAFDEIGGFDERFFMFMEDVDLCWRAGQAGWGVDLEPAAEAVHVIGASRAHHPYRMVIAHHRSMWLWSTLRWTGLARIGLPFVFLAIAVRAALVCALRFVQIRRALRPAR